MVVSWIHRRVFQKDELCESRRMNTVLCFHALSAASFNLLISSLTIFKSASMTRCDLAESLPLNKSLKIAGTICHETPNLSLSQPHCCSLPPAESLFQ